MPSSLTLVADDVHALSNHLSVILGFVELILAEMPPEAPRRNDLIEIRDAAEQAARLVLPRQD